MLRAACVRFWLSRLIAAAAFAGQRDVLIKNPEDFRRLLQARQVVEPGQGLPFAL
jgi:homoserine kinase type II